MRAKVKARTNRWAQAREHLLMDSLELPMFKPVGGDSHVKIEDVRLFCGTPYLCCIRREVFMCASQFNVRNSFLLHYP